MDVPSVTLTIPAWILSSLGPIAAVVLAWWLNTRRLNVIHHDTNSALSKANQTIDELREEIKTLKRGRR